MKCQSTSGHASQNLWMCRRRDCGSTAGYVTVSCTRVHEPNKNLLLRVPSFLAASKNLPEMDALEVRRTTTTSSSTARAEHEAHNPPRSSTRPGAASGRAPNKVPIVAERSMRERDDTSYYFLLVHATHLGKPLVSDCTAACCEAWR